MVFSPPQKQKVHWIITDNYSRIVPLFSMICFLGVIIRWVIKYTMLFCKLFCTVGIFSLLQTIHTRKISKYFNTSQWTNQKPPHLLLNTCIFAIIAYMSYIISKPYQYKSYLDVYMRSLFSTISIFSISASMQCFFIKINVFSINSIRCGLVGIFQRIFVLIRAATNTAIWFIFYHYYLGTVLVLYIYLIIKFSMFCYLLIEFKATLSDYFQNKRDLLVGTEVSPGTTCLVCFDDMIEPIVFKCTHNVCFNCAMQCAAINAKCPFCREPFRYPKRLEIGNGHIPFVFLLASL